jgi:predicted porin
VRRDEYIKFSADPGIGTGHVPQTVFIRLGLIGVETPLGNVSIGRQWGVNYTLAGNIDDMYLGGAYAIGVYNAGTDGGISGTGRADQVLKYEFIGKKFYLGAQSQFRNISENNQFFADSYGFASSYSFGKIKVGVSYNKVLDGVEVPTPTQAKINDELISALIDYRTKKFHFGIMPVHFVNHEKNNVDSFFTGYGLEYSIRYHFGKKQHWRIVQNSYLLLPSNKESKYRLNGYTFNLAYRYSDNTAIILGFTYDNSVNVDGSRPEHHIVGIGLYYNFNYPVP